MSSRVSRINILLITYNHEKYVRRALDGVASQIVDEPVTVVVADDCSTDGTLDIVRAFAAEHPHLDFRFLEADCNLGVTRNYKRAFAACDGDYVAVLEGDDYWVAPHKLAKQRDFLDVRLECDLCSVNYYVFEENRAQFTPRWAPGTGHMLLGARELIADNVVGNFSTCMYRLSALRAIPVEVYDYKSYDWIINILIARQSLIAFLHEPMSVYRIHGDGVWSVLTTIEKLKVQRDLLPQYDDLTGNMFTPEFSALKHRLDHVIESGEIGHAAPGVLGASEERTRIREWFPPFVLPLARWIVPVAFRRALYKIITRSAS
ncbi:glycosyltransferase [Dyella subtropica]|uniref:glycosyltransferase n=1 Tax=Dyella subtropica TaxID=2992127 RepID=UPI002258BC27|nr:glycosyltransferase [Dyella subtropica]